MNQRKRLLLVNDDMVRGDHCMQSFTRCFAKFGIDIIGVATAKEALEQAKNSKFDLIVTDISLGAGESGITLVKEIRKFDKQIKIFVYTGHGDYYKQEALKAGATEYYEKPYDLPKHFLKPLGIDLEEEKAKKREEEVVNKTKGTTLRWTVHEVGNRHNCVVMVSSLLKEEIEQFLKRSNASEQDNRAMLEKAMADLADVEEAGKNADKLLKKVRKAVYKEVNPDEVIVEEG